MCCIICVVSLFALDRSWFGVVGVVPAKICARQMELRQVYSTICRVLVVRLLEGETLLNHYRQYLYWSILD
jgi:hypothetical protein